MVRVSASKYADLSGRLSDNLADGDPTFYGLGPNGERRCSEQLALYYYDSSPDYKSGAVVMTDGTRMATTSALARERGWEDLAVMMEAKGL